MSNALTPNTQTPQTAADLPCLLIPLHSGQLLLPNVTVAEIIPFTAPIPKTSQPSWIIGQISWRGTLLAMVSFEAINNQLDHAKKANLETARILVLNGVGQHQQHPFFAMLIQGIPKLIRINESDLKSAPVQQKKPAEKLSVLVNGETVIIPDLDFIEDSLGAM